MKKAIILILVLINTFSLSNCQSGAQEPLEYNPQEYDSRKEAAYCKEISKEILRCFDDKDTDNLISMFSEDVQSEYDLQAQIGDAFEIYGGKSVSHVRFKSNGYTSNASKNGVYVQKNIGADICNITTDDNNIFTISFVTCVIDDDEPDKLGMKTIYLTDPEYGHVAIIGYVQDFQTKILEENNKKRNNNKSPSKN